jgi:monoamine oxidase
VSGARDDVIVIGAGFAGAAAAARLCENGRKVRILEARERVGGRAYTRPFAGGGPLLEFGGAWITPWQSRVRAHAQRCGIGLRPRIALLEHRRPDGLDGDPALARIVKDAIAYGEGRRADGEGRSYLTTTLNAYLDRIAAGPAVRAEVMAWWAISGYGDPDIVSAGEFISSCAYGEGKPEGMLDKLVESLDPGASVLVERMIAASGAALDLDWPVAAVRQEGDGVTVRGTDGREARGAVAILAVPLNAVGDIAFTPGLNALKAQAAARRHVGASVKVWIEAEGVRPGRLSTGAGGSLPWMFAERRTDAGSTLIVGFGLAKDFAASEGAVEAALRSGFSDAKLLRWDTHDWVGDSWARGTWVALPADACDMADPDRWRPQRRLVFAGSDIASGQPGWFEGAIESGEAAASLALAGQAA